MQNIEWKTTMPLNDVMLKLGTTLQVSISRRFRQFSDTHLKDDYFTKKDSPPYYHGPTGFAMRKENNSLVRGIATKKCKSQVSMMHPPPAVPNEFITYNKGMRTNFNDSNWPQTHGWDEPTPYIDSLEARVQAFDKERVYGLVRPNHINIMHFKMTKGSLAWVLTYYQGVP